MFTPTVFFEGLKASSPFMAYVGFIALFALLGFLIKFIDDAFDEGVFNKKVAVVLAPIAGILWALAMMATPISATILAAIMIGVLISGKLDNLAFWVVGVSIVAVLFFFGIPEFLLIPLVVLVIAAFLDELGNDFFDKLGIEDAVHPIIYYFFYYRLTLKLVLAYFVFFQGFSIIYLIALLAFSAAYYALGMYSSKATKKWGTRLGNSLEF
ncbi:MAG: hypothetical protein Q7R70_05485 [Candidatus Diapherotrites archaeon]|nr:hypothetical protein [Candidatus Diapherotrites archaeon]